MDSSFLDFFNSYKTVMLIVKPDDGKILNANKHACDYYGYSKEELLKMHVQDLNTLSEERIKQEMKLALKSKRNYFNLKHKLKNGELRDIELHSSPIVYDNQKALLSIIHDETSKIEEMLEIRSELESTLNAIPNLLFELSIDGVYLKIISNKPELLAAPKEELLGKHISDFLPREATQTCLRALQEADKTGYSTGKIIEIQTPAGKRWFELSASKKNSINGKEPTFVLLSTDITERKEFEIQMIDAQDRFKALHDSASGGIVIHENGLILECNAKLCEMSGHSYEELINSNGLELISPKAVDTVIANIKNGYEKPYESLGITKNGREFPLRIESREIIYKNKPTRVTEFIDISSEKEANKKLSLAASVFSHAREGIMITDIEGKIVKVNDSFSFITGYSRNEVIGKKPNILQSGIHKREFYEKMWENITNKDYWHGEIYNKRKNGEIYPEMLTISAVKSNIGDTEHYIGIFSDISLAKENEQRLENMAHYDSLTRLPNRVLFLDRLEQAIFQAKRRETNIAILFIDLDYFKEVNDRFGHDVGDKLLVKLTSNMQKVLREEDTVARFGGDEFVGLLVGLQNTYSCIKIADKLLNTLSNKITIGSLKLQVSASIGIALYPDDNVDPEILIRHADQAMYEAKQDGKNRYKVFNANSCL